MYKESEFIAKAAEAAEESIVAHTEASLKRPGELLAQGGLLAASRSALVFVVEDILEPGEAFVLPTREVRGIRIVEGILGEQLVVDSTSGELTISNIRLGAAAKVLAACGLAGQSHELAVEPDATTADPKSAKPDAEDELSAMAFREPAPPSEPPLATPSTELYAEWMESPEPSSPSSEALRDFVDPTADLVFDEARYSASLGKPERYALVPDTSGEDLVTTDEDEPAAPVRATGGRSCLLVLLALLLTAGSGIAVYLLQMRGDSANRIDASAAPAVEGIWEEGQIVRTALPTVDPRSPVTVFFRSFPGNQADWISVVPSGSADDFYDQWHFVEGRRDGLIVVPPLDEGEREVRAYFDWPDGGYDVRDRYPFSVRRQY